VNITAVFFWWFFFQHMLFPFIANWFRIGSWAVENEKRHSEDEEDGDELFSMSMYGSMGD
jgi:hypothetical protein